MRTTGLSAPRTSVLRTAVLLLVMAVAGCSSERAGDDRGDTSHTSATTTPSVDTRDSAPPLQLTERELGPLRIGATLAEATAAAGVLEVPVGADTATCAYARWRGGPSGVHIMLESGRIVRIDVDSSGIRTAAGVGVNDAEAVVQRAYGARAVVSPHKYTDGHYLTVLDPSDSTFALVFETEHAKVTRFRSGRRPQVEYVEGCS